MANEGVRTTSPGMQQAGQVFGTTVEKFTTQYNGVQQNMQFLMASWQGDAARTFGSAMEPWYAEFNKVIARLAHMQETMHANRNLYDETEMNNISMGKKLGAGLPGM